jgi:FkbM family methyltransferase
MDIINRIKSNLRQLYAKLFHIREIKCQRNGVKFLLDLEKDVDYRFYLNEFEQENLNLYLSKISPGSVVFDVGANIGIYSLLASKKTGPTGKVISFEPATWAFHRLKKNIEINGFQNVTPIQKGVSDESKEMTFNICDDDAYNSLGNAPMQQTKNTVIIQTVSIDAYVAANNLRKIDVIKVDTEGAEYLVFKGAEKTLKTYRPILFFEFNPYTAPGFAFDKLEAVRFLESLGYGLYEYINNKLVKIENHQIKTYDIIGFPE